MDGSLLIYHVSILIYATCWCRIQWYVCKLYFKIRDSARYLFAVMGGRVGLYSHMKYPMSKKALILPDCLPRPPPARSLRLPRILVSDGLAEFCKAATNVFYRVAGPRFVHVRYIHIQNIFNQNNVYERLNGEFWDRLQCTPYLKSKKIRNHTPTHHTLQLFSSTYLTGKQYDPCRNNGYGYRTNTQLGPFTGLR